jgi:hypothetical protein
VLAAHQADCRIQPQSVIALTRTEVPAPPAPTDLQITSAIRLNAPAGARLGRVIGLTRTWSGSILAATDRGYWIRVPSEHDESLSPVAKPIAATMRDLPGRPEQMVFWGWSGEPGYVGANVWISVAGAAHLLTYEVGGCFPGARPQPALTFPPGEYVFRLVPGIDSRPDIVLQSGTGQLHHPPRSSGDLRAQPARRPVRRFG